MKCEKCGTYLPCVNIIGVCKVVCKECDGQFKYCYSQCEIPCRTKEEQEKLFNEWEPEWKVSMTI